MRVAALTRLFASVAFVCAGALSQESTLESKVKEASEQLRQLEDLYRRSADPAEKILVLANVMERAGWAEQAGGLRDARDDQLLALARLERLGVKTALRYGFLSSPSGTSIVELTARAPLPDELPDVLRPLSEKLLLVQIANRGARPLSVAGDVTIEITTPLRGNRRMPVLGSGTLPEGAKSKSEFFAWPERIAPGEAAQALVLLPQAAAEISALIVALAEPGNENAVTAILHFAENQYPDRYTRIKEEARKIEAQIDSELAARRPAKPKEVEKPKPPDLPAPNPAIPDAIGTIERLGTEDRVQLRLPRKTTLLPSEVLRVRKGDAWIGKVKVPERLISAGASGDQTIMFVRVIEGKRDDMPGATVHEE